MSAAFSPRTAAITGSAVRAEWHSAFTEDVRLQLIHSVYEAMLIEDSATEKQQAWESAVAYEHIVWSTSQDADEYLSSMERRAGKSSEKEEEEPQDAPRSWTGDASHVLGSSSSVTIDIRTAVQPERTALEPTISPFVIPPPPSPPFAAPQHQQSAQMPSQSEGPFAIALYQELMRLLPTQVQEHQELVQYLQSRAIASSECFRLLQQLYERHQRERDELQQRIRANERQQQQTASFPSVPPFSPSSRPSTPLFPTSPRPPSSASAFSFSPPGAASNVSGSTGFTFGSPPSTTSGFSFGSPSTGSAFGQSTGFSFGSPSTQPPQQYPPSPLSSTAFGSFGQSSSPIFGSPASSIGGGFGQSSTAAGFAFGASSSAPRQGTTPPSSPPADGFLASRDTYSSSSVWTDPAWLALLATGQQLTVRIGSLVAQHEHTEVWRSACGQFALKGLRGNPAMTDVAAFVARMSALSSLSARLVAKPLAALGSSALTLRVVTAFAERGDLRSLLLATGGDNNSGMSWEEDKSVIALDVAEALEYVHSQNVMKAVVVGDLHAGHVLVNGDGHARVNLVSFSTAVCTGGQSGASSTSKQSGFPYWLSPELLKGVAATTASDVYAFGVLLCELDTGVAPFSSDGRSLPELHAGVMSGELRPSVSDSCPPRIHQLAVECMVDDPTLRPSAAQVVYRLRDIMKNDL